MSLVADYSDSSEEDEEETSSQKSDNNSPPGKPLTQKLPPPPITLPSASSALSKASKKTGEVFSNPFLEAELHKTASLERHVKMVNNDTHLQLKNGRKICWNYRKGRCRFGTSCQYAHDSDLSVNEEKEANQEPAQMLKNAEPAHSNNSKRKRPGLGDGLEPGKRVMKSYQQSQRR
ncbi:uncharacterized protein Dwil_GK22866 [Drosophila willistoni]|uniref:C3H1-type domain-containing protein n=1 Tax=Drosophila willistoni TaxID=7260 RepID=B4NNM2_DROWI|nr:uncharacterized protein Dwil_GK22866 [Drosophila willistoni]